MPRKAILTIVAGMFCLFVAPVAAQSNLSLLKDINPDQDESSGAGSFANLNGTFFFAAMGSDGSLSRLWKSNGTTAGTVDVLDASGSMGLPSNLYPWNGYVYFQALAGVNGSVGFELWRSNGTTAGTTLVKDINPASTAGGFPHGFAAMGGHLYFSAIRNLDEGYELWRTDGTDAGTILVKDIDPRQYGSSTPQELTVCGSLLFFTAETGDITQGQTRQRELYISNGTNAGTKKVMDLGGATFDGDVKNLAVYNNKVYFSADDNAWGAELWVSDGTSTGTKLFKNISPLDSSSYPSQLTVCNGKLYFTASADGGFGPEIYFTDGTPGGTGRLYDFENDGRPDYGPQQLCAVGNTLFFTALEHSQTTFFSTGYELYKSNGSPGNATLVRDINTNNSQNPDTSGCMPVFFTAIDGLLYFAATDVTHGYELWVSNGTNAGTRIVKDLNSGSSDGIDINHFGIIQCGARVYFNALDGVHGNELWVMNPTWNAVPARIYGLFQ